MWDESLKFHEGAITASGGKTLTLDDNMRKSGLFYPAPGGPVAGLGLGDRPGRFVIQVTKAFNNLTNLWFSIKVGTTSATATTQIWTSGTIARAALVAGYILDVAVPSHEALRTAKYMRFEWNVTGTAPTAGEVYIGQADGIPIKQSQELR